jgi:hypothetical protein
MFSKFVLPACSLLLATAAIAADAPQPAASASLAAVAGKPAPKTDAARAKADADAKALSGMSILGNQEAPKALVIVPWKSSQLGDTLGIAKNLDDGRQPVDKDVFMRQLSYYEIRTGAK